VALIALGLAVAYLIGAVPVGVLVARAMGGVDPRQVGSGSIGATNVMRAMGRGPAAATLAGDVVKGALAVGAAAALAPPAWGAAAGAVAAVAGNCWSIFLGFRGGKGVATGLGAFLAVTPWAILPAAVVFAVTLAAGRLVSLASLLGVGTLPIAVAALGYPRPAVAAGIAAAVIVTVRHRQNLGRLVRGVEPRLGQRVGGA
jgi:glycerol-3-phosphate acyltransferase PlsY